MYSRAYVEITNVCNLRCSFCHGHKRDARFMTEAEFSHILDALEGKIRYLYYHLMGEPLLHPQLPAFLEMAKARGFTSVITTNGTLLSRRGEELIRAGVHKVSVSLHSFEEGSEEAFSRYLREVSDFADTASKAGVIVVFRLWNRGVDGGRNEKILSFLRRRFDGEWAENTKGLRIREKLHVEWGERFSWPDRDAPDSGDSVFCYGLSDHFGILADGSVVPCCLDSEGEITLGNLHDTPLDEILSSPRAVAMMEGFAKKCATEALCRRCGYARRFSK